MIPQALIPRLVAGNLVDVHRPGPLATWHAGYRFVRFEEGDRTCMVLHTEGTFEGVETRQPCEAVRHARPRGVGERVLRLWPEHGPGTVREFHQNGACDSCTGGPHAQVEWDDKPGELFDEDPADLRLYEENPPPGPAAENVPTTGDVGGLRRDVHTGRAWLLFVTKPTKATCELLSQAGWRFSGYRKEWHNPRKHVAPPPGVQYVEEGTVNYSEERPERLKARSVAARTEAAQLFERERKIGDMIPMGQPILIGHHSEKRHRRDIAKIQNLATRGVEAFKESERLDRAADNSAHLRERRLSDPGLVERRLRGSRKTLARMEAHILKQGDKVPDDLVRRSHLVRAEIERDEKLLAELQAEAGAPAEVAVGDVVDMGGARGAFLIGRVNHRTFTGWNVGGGADAWPGRIDKSKWDGKILHRATDKLREAVAYRLGLQGCYGDAKWRELTAEIR